MGPVTIAIGYIYFTSLVVIASLVAHAYARPFKDPWVDATEGLSLWSTLFVFQGGDDEEEYTLVK